MATFIENAIFQYITNMYRAGAVDNVRGVETSCFGRPREWPIRVVIITLTLRTLGSLGSEFENR